MPGMPTRACRNDAHAHLFAALARTRALETDEGSIFCRATALPYARRGWCGLPGLARAGIRETGTPLSRVCPQDAMGPWRDTADDLDEQRAAITRTAPESRRRASAVGWGSHAACYVCRLREHTVVCANMISVCASAGCIEVLAATARCEGRPVVCAPLSLSCALPFAVRVVLFSGLGPGEGTVSPCGPRPRSPDHRGTPRCRSPEAAQRRRGVGPRGRRMVSRDRTRECLLVQANASL
jgi:hypothetical protein